MFKKSFPFCLNHLWAYTFSICSTENGTILYCAWKAVCVGALSNFSCKWMLLLPVFHFALAITWFQHKREKKKPPSLQPTLLECSIIICAYACSFIIFQLVSNHWFHFYTLYLECKNGKLILSFSLLPSYRWA